MVVAISKEEVVELVAFEMVEVVTLELVVVDDELEVTLKVATAEAA